MEYQKTHFHMWDGWIQNESYLTGYFVKACMSAPVIDPSCYINVTT